MDRAFPPRRANRIKGVTAAPPSGPSEPRCPLSSPQRAIPEMPSAKQAAGPGRVMPIKESPRSGKERQYCRDRQCPSIPRGGRPGRGSSMAIAYSNNGINFFYLTPLPDRAMVTSFTLRMLVSAAFFASISKGKGGDGRDINGGIPELQTACAQRS